MFILLDPNTPSQLAYTLEELVIKHIGDKAHRVPIETYSLDDGEYVFEFYDMEKSNDPWLEMKYAALGARFYSSTEYGNSPIASPMTIAPHLLLEDLVVDAAYSRSRAEFVISSGAHYIGRTALSPRVIFVVDNKKGNTDHSPEKDKLFDVLLGSLPEDFLPLVGIVSALSVEKLETLLERLHPSVILSTSSGSRSKLDYLGFKYASIPEVPEAASTEYGIKIREITNSFSNIGKEVHAPATK